MSVLTGNQVQEIFELAKKKKFALPAVNIGTRQNGRLRAANVIDVDHSANTDLDLGKGTQPIRLGLLVGGGAEYNISGTTSLFFALHYHYFATNALTREQGEDYLRELNENTGKFQNVGAKSIPGSVSLTIGVLF